MIQTQTVPSKVVQIGSLIDYSVVEEHIRYEEELIN